MKGIQRVLEDAEAAVKFAQDTRTLHRKRTSRLSPQRKADVRVARQKLATAMRPLHRYISRIPYRAPRDEDEAARAMSQALQRERRKLWKFVPKNPPKRR